MTNIRRYMDSASLFITDLRIVADSPMQICSACTCPTGKTIYAATLEGQETKMVALGFKVQQR